MHDDTTGVDWRGDGIPVSRRFDDPYFSLQGGLDETRHVFLAGNGLPGRYNTGFQIAELGFGTGLNLLAAWAAWREAGVPGQLRYASFEAFPLSQDEIARALAAFPGHEDLAAQIAHGMGGPAMAIETPDLSARVILGDARKTLPHWQGRADAWFLDGFAPAKNPEMWEPALLDEVARHTRRGGTLATYSAAGHVRRSLEASGFHVQRVPGFGTKRHMTSALMPPHESSVP